MTIIYSMTDTTREELTKKMTEQIHIEDEKINELREKRKACARLFNGRMEYLAKKDVDWRDFEKDQIVSDNKKKYEKYLEDIREIEKYIKMLRDTIKMCDV